MSYFSGTVLLGELDDFIAPAQACSTGVFGDATSTSGGKMQLVMEDDLGDDYGYARVASLFFFISATSSVIQTNVAKVASVSLADCLACTFAINV